MTGYFFGTLALKLNPALLLGSVTGAMTSTPALTAVQEAAKSSMPALGYAGTYAFANVLLTVVQNIRAAGIVTVHSAGNSGSSCSSTSFPSSRPRCPARLGSSTATGACTSTRTRTWSSRFASATTRTASARS